MSNHNKESTRILRLVIIYFVLAWMIVSGVGLLVEIFDFPNWILQWVKLSAYTVFPVTFVVFWLVKHYKDKQSEEAFENTETLPKTRKANGSITTLAILPLNKGGDQMLNSFAAGMAQDMVMAFSAVPGLQVISRNATTGDKKVADLHEIIQRVTMRNVLEGEVVEVGDYPAVNVRLKDAVNNTIIWSKKYKSGQSQIFDMQHEIFEAVLRELSVPIPDYECFHHRTDDVSVYRDFLLARSNFNRREEGLLMAKNEFESLLERAPDYAPALAGLANTYNLLGFYELAAPNDVYPKAKNAAIKAVALNRNLVEAQTALAYYETVYEWNWEKAAISFQKALNINRGYATANHWYAEYLMAIGQVDQAIKRSRQAQKHDPLDLIINTLLGMAYYFSRKFKESISEGEKTLSMAQDFTPVYSWLGMAYEQAGKYDDAVAILMKGKTKTSGKSAKLNALLAHAQAKSGNIAAAHLELDELNIRVKRSYISAYNFARIYLALGQEEEALNWLDKAFEERATWLTWIKVDPAFDALRNRPQLQDLLEKMNFPKN